MKILPVIIILLSPLISFSQIKNIGLPFITKYTPDIYDAANQNWAFNQDNNGILYVGNSSGLLMFDGNIWTNLSLRTQSDIRAIAFSPEGKLYTCGENFLGYLTIDSLGYFVLKDYNHLIPEKYKPFGNVWNVYYINKHIVYETTNYLFILRNNKLSVIESKDGFHASFNVENNLYIREWGKGLQILDINSKKLNLIDGGDLFAWEKVYSILPYGIDTVIIAAREKGFFLYDKHKLIPHRTQADFIFQKSKGQCGATHDNYFVYGTIIDGIFIMDKTGRIVQHLNKDKGLPENVIHSLFFDKFKNLWIGTSSGLAMAEIFSPLTIIDERHKLFSKPLISYILGDYLVAGGDQLLYYKKWDLIENPLKTTDFKPLINSDGQTWKITNVDDTYFLSHNPGILKLDKSLKIITLREFNMNNVWDIKLYDKSKKQFIITTNTLAYSAQITNQSIQNIVPIKKFPENARNFVIDKNKNIWVSTENQGIFKLKLNQNCDSVISEFQYNSSNSLPENFLNNAFLYQDKVYISTAKQIYVYDEKSESIVLDTTLNKYLFTNQGCYYINVDSDENIFVYDSLGMVLLKNFGKNQFVANHQDFLRLKELPIYHLTNLSKDNYLIGMDLGLIHYNSTIKNPYFADFKCLIREISKIGSDSVLFYGNFHDTIFNFSDKNNKIREIDYKNNSLRFHYSGVYFVENKKIVFSHKLEGYDNAWSEWSNEISCDYANLPFGKYVFRVKAKNIFDVISAEDSIAFIILSPWYQTIWAFICYFFLLIGIVSLAGILWTRRLRKQNLKLEKIVSERTSELRQKNEEIIQQNEEILKINAEIIQQKEEIQAQTEQLELVNKELEKLSIVASETDNAVLIMDNEGNFEWLNSAYSRIFGYTFNELVNLISPNIIGPNTPQYIVNQVNECILERKTVNYQFETFSKEGKKIWVQTTLTPIINDSGEISKLIAIDSDITKLKIAEKEIQQQNTKIKGSIQYALTIQNATLPDLSELQKQYESFLIYRPKDIVSGDFYWFYHFYKISEPDSMYVAVGDCTGHGVPGAFMSMISSRLLNDILKNRNIYQPSKILDVLDIEITKSLKQNVTDNRDGLDICLCKLQKNQADNNQSVKITYAGAKLSLYFYYSQTDDIQKLPADRKNLGGSSIKNFNYSDKEIILHRNSVLYLASDGYVDQNNKNRKRFGRNRFIRLLKANCCKSLTEQKIALENELNIWQKDEEQRDDITILAIKI